jgi:hypothetical protein
MEIISAKDAGAANLKKYYTGKPCKHGHDSERYVKGGTCVACVYAANGHAPLEPGAAPVSKGVPRAVLLEDFPEFRHRAYPGDVKALQMLATMLCQAVNPALTSDDVRSRKPANGTMGPTAKYAFHYPPAQYDMMNKYANELYGSHSRASVALDSAARIEMANRIALEERAAGLPGEWSFQ